MAKTREQALAESKPLQGEEEPTLSLLKHGEPTLSVDLSKDLQTQEQQDDPTFAGPRVPMPRTDSSSAAARSSGCR